MRHNKIPGNKMNIVICTDLKTNFIYGVFLEVLYHLERRQPGNNIALIIVGERDKERIESIEKLIHENIKIDKKNICSYCCTEVIGETKRKEIKDFSKLSVKKINNIREISKIEYMGFQVGIPVLSNLIELEKSTRLNIDKSKKILPGYIYYSLATYFSFLKLKSLFKKIKNHQYYIYNGRTYNTYPITISAPEESVNYYERFDYGRKLRIQRYRIHDFKKGSNLVKELWEKSEKSLFEKERIGRMFFEEHQSNIYTKKFSSNGLDILNCEKKIITYFISSNDEFASLHPEIKINTIFDSQEDALEYLANWVKEKKDYKLVLRIHPHYERKCKIDRDFWNNINIEGVEVISSASSVSSYELIKRSHLVVSYISTTGIEATYLGVPSIILSNSPYSGIDAVYEPTSRKQLNCLLESTPPPKPLKNCLPYGFFMKEFGIDFGFLINQNISGFEELEKIINNDI